MADEPKPAKAVKKKRRRKSRSKLRRSTSTRWTSSKDLDVHQNVLRKWVKEFGSDPAHAFPGHGQMKPEQLEIERLRREARASAGLPA